MSVPSNSLQDTITAHQTQLEDAIHLIHQGHAVDITPLKSAIEDCCTALTKLPTQQGRALVPALETLLETLERLERDLDMQHEEISKHLQFREKTVNPLFAQEIDD